MYSNYPYNTPSKNTNYHISTAQPIQEERPTSVPPYNKLPQPPQRRDNRAEASLRN